MLGCFTVLLGFGSINCAAAGLPFSPFEARYTIFGRGLPIGQSVMSLSDEGNGRYAMLSEVQPNGLIGLFASAEIRERAGGEFRDGVILPSNYEQYRRNGDKSTTTRLSFDWRNHSLHAQSNAEQATLPLAAGTIDPLSLHLQVMWDLQQGRKPDRYTLVDDTELKTYQVKLEGEETLDTPLGKLQTVRISRSKPGGSRVTTLWFAPSLDYLTVQITQQKKGREELRMLIQEVKGLGGR